MKLAELEPKFLKKDKFDPEYPSDWNRGSSVNVDAPADADFMTFLCPVCFLKNDGPQGTHRVVIEKPHVPVTVPGDGRWNLVGTGANDLTLKGVTSDSVLIPSPPGCGAHFFIIDGEVKFA